MKALIEKLSKAGFVCLPARNGKEGLEIARKNQANIILLDIVMPVMDGLSFLQKMKADKKIKVIPVIILTNLSDESKVEESQQKGATDYLVKSDWKIEDVVKIVKERLK